MATTYSTNAEIRLSFPGIDNCLPVTKINGAVTSGASSITVDSTEAFPLTGTLYVLSTSNVLSSFSYDRKDRSTFYLSSNVSFDISDNSEVTTGDATLDHLRELAKSWVDSILTNYNIPTDYRKSLEIQRVFYLAAISSYDPNKRDWADQVMRDMQSFIKDILKQYPPVIGRNIAYLASAGLTERDKEYLRNGPYPGGC